ncbi:hypothetical protein HCH_05622 [Hahella chejuensis KCTC 2396]|uniref:Uncharacterized protein n=1 Tax=Hahella chejuensis (strain KCTC 2396) TaxID=349521 RepID=Q2SAP4_HAHCH|nr:hypothetical protein HCH_05622 [Hahella chejuensis KCTC 2396]
MNALLALEGKSHRALFLIIGLAQADESMNQDKSDFLSTLFCAHTLWRNGLAWITGGMVWLHCWAVLTVKLLDECVIIGPGRPFGHEGVSGCCEQLRGIAGICGNGVKNLMFIWSTRE